MKQIVKSGGGGRRRWKTPTEEEVEVVQVLLGLPKLCAKSEFIRRYGFNWGRKKKRSVLLDSKSESLTSPLTKTAIDGGVTENVTAAEADKSPSTPLCFLPSGSGSEGVDDNRKPALAVRKVLKRKETDDLIELCSTMKQEQDILVKKVKGLETCHQDLTTENLELKAIGQKINYPRNMEEFNIWWNNMRVIDQQRCHQQITMFTPATPQPSQYYHHHHQQLVVDPHNGGRFGIFNHIDPRHVEAYGFMASSQPLDDEQRARAAAAAARKRRKLRMKKEVDIEEDIINDPSVKNHGDRYDYIAYSQPLDQSKYMANDFTASSSSQPLDQSKQFMMDDDLRFRAAAAAARKRRKLRMKREVDIEEEVDDPSVNIHGENYGLTAACQPLDQNKYSVNDLTASSSSQPLDQSKYVVMDEDLRFRNEAAAARKRRILRMKESKNSLLAMKLSGACR